MAEVGRILFMRFKRISISLYITKILPQKLAAMPHIKVVSVLD
jgi:hypothetical protein